jgi:hypothetical protein
VALIWTWARSFSVAVLALYSCVKLKNALPTTIPSTMSAVSQSPTTAEISVANSRMRMIALLNWLTKTPKAVVFWRVFRVFGPTSSRRLAASDSLKPLDPLPSPWTRASGDWLQYGLGRWLALS